MKEGQYIIAIGASAGGMAQINTFFDFTPLDSVSYIVIQHLSADYKSMMAALLAKHSKLNVLEAESGMTVEMNKVYMIPSKSSMTIKDGKLLLADKQKGVNLTIDTFFESLAEEMGEKAIGIVLSGTGQDGTAGITAIKKAGGLVIVSKPEASEYDQMPISAIATGLVNYTAYPEEMPLLIQRYVGGKVKEAEINIDEDDEKVITGITELIKDKLPEDFSGYKKSTILRRIRRRASLLNFNTIENYLGLLKKDMAELQTLVKDFLISVTAFFRDKAAFQVLEESFIPEMIESKHDEDIKVWVAGCATGEEAYTFAILMRERLDAANKKNTVKIFATDIDDDALQFAAKGYYSESIEKDVSPERLEHFFSKDNKGYRVKPSIREMLIFAHHDLVKNPPYCNIDFISCRNLLIYMNPTLQKKILNMLHFGMRYGGYLFLGPSENVTDFMPHLEERNKKWKIYKNIEAKRMQSFENFTSPAFIEGKGYVAPQRSAKIAEGKSTVTEIKIDTELLVEMGYTGLLIDENDQVLDVFGESTRFLSQKMFVHHLPDLLSKSLQIAFITAGIEADKTNKLVAIKGIKVTGIDSPVTLSVKPLAANEKGIKTRLVLFFEDGVESNTQNTFTFDESFFRDKYTVNVEQELALTKEKLASTHELLNASNENMQSFNEELLSANEEMQSTNEEMQSVNEELHTINAEYQSKIRELSDLNDDLNNYFRSNVNGQIFVNKDLRLMKFSPGAETHINLLEIDIGRPLSNISTNIRFETIEKDIRKVLDDGCVITRELHAVNGKWFQVMTMPYLRKGNNETDGAIITFNDISELKKIQQELSHSNQILKAINTDLDNFVFTSSHDLLSPMNNIEQIIYFIKEREKVLDKETRDYVNMLSVAVGRFRSVIKEMAAIGKMESEMFNMEIIDIDEIIGEVLASIEWRISSDHANIQTQLEVKNINFSRKNCRSMIYNLINNALKFKSPSRYPEITITTKDLPDYVLLSVKDNGIGISKHKIETIFKMYRQLNAGTDGQGLGLFLINKIIDASGGKVEVESQPDVGTEFRIFIKK
ncbi:two-component system, chemotaxis family, CheB/CheR fusion protein [Chitinophaga sp. CF118]|uniref:CheR family methyltransferase n=1 Tax=Chitinophaga sp. CF118 TaxID=1884367 RepID=UPI0008F1D6EB|nr:CheR family methyltransferase [Chitinophaga sp. CF118]SFD88639.1 two-component system, chemotaxis family, CheB/CheR fusion protein [Chitinophaga sp. CF118]